MDEAPGEFETTPSDVWARWVTALMAYPDYSGNDPAFLRNLVARACQDAPHATVAAATGQSWGRVPASATIYSSWAV